MIVLGGKENFIDCCLFFTLLFVRFNKIDFEYDFFIFLGCRGKNIVRYLFIC